MPVGCVLFSKKTFFKSELASGFYNLNVIFFHIHLPAMFVVAIIDLLKVLFS